MPSPPFTIYACYHCPNRRTIATIGPLLSSSRSTATLLHLIGKIDVATIVDAMDRQLFFFSTTTTTPHLLKSHINTISTIRTQCIANYTFINDVKLNFLDDRLVCVGYSSAGLLALMSVVRITIKANWDTKSTPTHTVSTDCLYHRVLEGDGVNSSGSILVLSRGQQGFLQCLRCRVSPWSISV
ncbi:hypothetical protein L1887_23823 [Cichorium endivia]|nr:hypothetical protein L1887_23823 [Cichorium endivia]